MKFDENINMKHDLGAKEGKRNAEREQAARWNESIDQICLTLKNYFAFYGYF